MTAEPQPTEAERQQAAQAGASVAQAAATAAEGSGTAEEARANASTAAQQEAARHGLEITEEQANMIATAVTKQFEARGAFDPPPDPVMAPPQPAQPAQPAGEEPVAAQPPPVPQRKSFAQKFLGE